MRGPHGGRGGAFWRLRRVLSLCRERRNGYQMCLLQVVSRRCVLFTATFLGFCRKNRKQQAHLSTAMSAITVLLAASSSGLRDAANDLLCANSAVAELTNALGRVDGVCVGKRDVKADNKGSFDDIRVQIHRTTCIWLLQTHRNSAHQMK